MEITQSKELDIVILGPTGRLDSNTSPFFEEKLLGSIKDGEKKIILDFGALDYISSAGLRVLLKAARELKQVDGKIVLCAMKDYIKEVFDLSGFVSILPIVADRDSALKSF